MTLEFLVLIMFVTSCITLITCKLITAMLYKRIVDDNSPSRKKSPYGITFQRHSGDDKMGYAITKNGKLFTDTDSNYMIYYNINSAIDKINILEKIEGYKITTL